MRLSRTLFVASLAALATVGLAQKKPLDSSVYDGWKSIRSPKLSRDGRWLAYVIAPQEGDAVGTIRATSNGGTITLARASAIAFSRDGKWALATIAPGFEAARKARRDAVPPAAQPKGALAIVDLEKGQVETVERVAAFSLPERDSGWFAYRLEPPKPAEKKEEKPAEGEDQRGGARRGGDAPAAPTRGATYVLRQFGKTGETRLEFTDATAWDEKGETFAYTTVADKAGKGSAVAVRRLAKGTTRTLAGDVDKAKYPKVALSGDGASVAFTTDREDLKSKKPALALYVAKVSEGEPKRVPVPGAEDGVNAGGAIRFTPTGKRLLFPTSKRPLPDPEAIPADERVSVDVWTTNDPQIMPQQLLRATAERNRGYDAIYDVASGKTVQIETPDVPSVQFGNEGDGPFGIASVDTPYRVESTWNPGYDDLYSVDLRTGTKTRLIERQNGAESLSPDGDTVAVYRSDRRAWSAIDLRTGRETPLAVPFPVYDELDDYPDLTPAYGLGGWTKDGKVIVRDRYDLWLCDPKGAVPPQNLTNGRASDVEFTPVDLDRKVRTVDPNDLPLVALNERTKDGGLFWRRDGTVKKYFLGDRKYAILDKADDAETLVFSRQDATEYPDLWLTNVRFEKPERITEANPQQKEYNWLKSELVTWTSADGTPLQGILYKPEDFDYGKKYPMISYFYERNSDGLHDYKAPAPSASTINIPLFVSQGYLVFVPDIPYKTGAPGPSALSAIVPGVNSIVSRGYVDPKRLGIQGQSWGGYQVAYLVTATDMFAAAEAGAPVVDMFSAYGGIRYGSGALRQMQYEHGQSRIGGTPWNSFLKYVDNSPVFHADSIRTPLMIMSNDKDGAVPHTQGIEMYSAMRRLGKPCWMVVYNDEDHNLVQRKNRKDLSIRLSQFFDHFLKGAPMPVWMKEGVSGVDKGRTMGTELTKP